MALLLNKISEINAVSGNETALRRYLEENISADKIFTDTMGNLFALVKGESSEKTLAVLTHTDESGFIVSGYDENGYIKFKGVGDIDLRTIISKRVIINNSVPGVIGMKAIHLQKKEERENIAEIEHLFIDIGAANRSEAQGLAAKGDYIAFDTKFADLGETVKGKALTRAGVWAAASAMHQKPKYDTYFIFCVQKEVGSRGAMIAAHRIKADAALLLDSTDADDVYKVREISAAQGGGAVLICSDKGMIRDNRTAAYIAETAAAAGIKIQIRNAYFERSDSLMQQNAAGCPCARVCIPVRYARSPVQTASKSDINAAARLVEAVVGGEYGGIFEWNC